MSNEEPRGGRSKDGRKADSKLRREIRSDPDIKYISDKSAHTIHAVSCPVLDTLPDGIALGGRPAFPKKWYCVCEKCLPQAAQEYKSRMRDSLEAKCSIRHGMIPISDMRAMQPSAFAIANIHLAVRAFQPKNYSSYLSSLMLA